MDVAAQVSLYPLRSAHLTPAIEVALAALRRHGLEVRPGSMSTLVSGDERAVFDALRESFVASESVNLSLSLEGRGLGRG